MPIRLYTIILCALLVETTPATAWNTAPSFTDSRKAVVEKLLLEKMEAEGIPGLSVALVIDGKLAWANGYGSADLENSVPATAATAYRTASIGKALTATAVMQLVEKSKIDLDRPIQAYCPTFPAKRWPITTRHLLSHTSGIRHYGGHRNEEELFNTVHYTSVVSALKIFQNDPLQFEPGTAFRYTTFGYNVLGCVAEGASGEAFLDYMRSQVFEPARMLDTRDDDPAAIIPRRAAGYRRGADGKLRNSRAVDMSSKMPAGGFITTAVDLASFAAAIFDNRLLQPDTFRQMTSLNVLRDETITTYGLGWGLSDPDDLWYGEQEVLHGGGTPLVSGILYLLPNRRFAVVLLANLESVSGRTELAAQIAKCVLDLGSVEALETESNPGTLPPSDHQ